jgi:hypothetical protein
MTAFLAHGSTACRLQQRNGITDLFGVARGCRPLETSMMALAVARTSATMS